MDVIQKKYIVDEHNKKVEVQLDINTYRKIEDTLENYALVQLINDGDNDEALSLEEAKVFYETLDKAP